MHSPWAAIHRAMWIEKPHHRHHRLLPRATSSNALFMDGLLVCAARFLASAALRRYSSDRDHMQGEHWRDASVPQIHRTLREVLRWSVGHLRLPTNPAQMTSPGPPAITALRRVGALTRSAPCLICALG